LSKESLADVQALYIINPTNPFTDQEVNTILDRVRSGLTLVIAGDHTNISEVRTSLTPVLRRTNIRLNNDSAIPDSEYPQWRHATWKRRDLENEDLTGNSLAVSVGASLLVLLAKCLPNQAHSSRNHSLSAFL
jgi:hypothetical protein